MNNVKTKLKNIFKTISASSFFWVQASSEHPLAKAILAYVRHFHFMDEPSATKIVQNHGPESKSVGWLLDVSDFSALPGRGIHCFIGGKEILVSFSAPTMDERGLILKYLLLYSCVRLFLYPITRLATGS